MLYIREREKEKTLVFHLFMISNYYKRKDPFANAIIVQF